MAYAGGCGRRQDAVALQPDGKIIVAGSTTNTAVTTDFAAARFNPDGTLDTTFGDGGYVSTDFHGGMDRPYEVLVQGDGRIVLVGTAALPTSTTRWRWSATTADGSLDTTFDGDGNATLGSKGRACAAPARGRQNRRHG